MTTAQLGCDEWSDTLTRLVDWAQYLINNTMVTEREAFERIAKLLNSEHFGVEHCALDNWDDISADEAPSMEYLNQGDTYATTLILTDDYINGVSLLIASWGDWYEETERHHFEESSVVRCGYCSHLTPFDAENDDWHNHQCEYCDHNVSG